MSESLVCSKFNIIFSLFCRKSVQSWMRRLWAKKCRRDHLRSLWRSVMPVTVRRWQHREAAEGRWGSLTKCGITKLVTVRHGYDGPSCRFVVKIREVIQYPDSKSWSILKRDPRRTVVPMTVRHTCRRGEWRKQQKKLHQVWDVGVHDGPSRGPSTQPRFGRFPVIRILV